jgi:DNA polymerase-3 subunit delta'
MLYPWQTKQWQSLSLQYEQQRLPHAIILSGVNGLGQLSLANKIVATVLCDQAPISAPCGGCHNCQVFAAGNHPDHTFVGPDENGKQIKIEQIRELKQKHTLTANTAKWKTAIIWPAENMNINASNSLLKLLEEPQSKTLLILISVKPQLLPVTILSRCQKVSLTVPTNKQAIGWIEEQERETYEEIQIKHALLLSNGAPLEALRLLSSKSLDYLEQISKDFNAILSGVANPVILAKQWQEYDLSMVLHYLQLKLKQRLVKNIESSDSNIVFNGWAMYDCIIHTTKLLSSSHNLNKVLLIERFMVTAMNLSSSSSTLDRNN